MLPPWLPLVADLPGRDAFVAEARAELERERTLLLCGPPGIGKTAVAGAVVAGGPGALRAVSLRGCQDAADATRALGDALGARPMGDEAAVVDLLRGTGPMLLVVDDIGSETALEALLRLLAAAPDVRTVLVAETPLDRRGYTVPPLGPEAIARIAPGRPVEESEGIPLLARLAYTFDAHPTEALARLGASAALLAAFPMGLAAAHSAAIPAVAAVPDAMDRVLLRRGVAARLVPAPDAAARVLPALDGLLSLARGSHPRALPDPRDLLLLRQLASTLPLPADVARCRAAAARLAIAFGQVPVARALVGEPLRAGGTPADYATLLWADGDALWAAGEVEDALGRWAEASSEFRRSREPVRAAALHRRAADRLAARGRVEDADRHYRLARQLYRTDEDDLGVASTLRGAADLAVNSGEWVSAGTLHEQVAATVDRPGVAPLERANLRIVDATLAMARGEYARAGRVLDGLATVAAEHPLLRANVSRRRADLLLRRGDHEAATASTRQAAAVYATLGEAGAHAACIRLLGDIAAAAGHLGAARGWYREALHLQVRVQDLFGLSRTLEHAAIVEDALGEAEAARRLREQRASVREVM